MDERNLSKGQNSNIIIESRRKANISGVKDVISFDESGIILDTELGTLSIKGHELRINKLNVDVGEFIIEGSIDSMLYSEGYTRDTGGFFSKIFK